MNNENYQISITVNANATEAMNAISNVAGWWTLNIEGHSSKLNDVFTVHFGETFVTFKITEFVPGKKIAWHVTDSYLPWLKDEKEWTNTTIEWQIAQENNATNIKMTHVGLTPSVECYESCEKGWNFFTGKSLLKLINAGKGLPDMPNKERELVN